MPALISPSITSHPFVAESVIEIQLASAFIKGVGLPTGFIISQVLTSSQFAMIQCFISQCPDKKLHFNLGPISRSFYKFKTILQADTRSSECYNGSACGGS